MLFTERGLPSCLCLLREISFKLKTQKAKEQKTTLCLRRGAATSAQGRRPARVRLPRPASAPPLRSGRPATPPRAQAGTPAAGPDRSPGARGGPARGRPGLGRLYGRLQRSPGGEEDARLPRGISVRLETCLPTPTPPIKMKPRPSRGRAGPLSAERLARLAKRGWGPGGGGPAPPRSGPGPRGGDQGGLSAAPGVEAGPAGLGGGGRTPAPPTRT